MYLDIVIPRQVEDIVEMMDSLLGRTKIVFAFDSHSWADPKVFAFLCLCASDAKVFCRWMGDDVTVLKMTQTRKTQRIADANFFVF